MKTAVKELEEDPDAAILEQLGLALGEFGIYGHESPCVLPLYSVVISVSRRLLQEKNTRSDRSLPRVRRESYSEAECALIP